jgi:BlaI family penicillinase repressor
MAYQKPRFEALLLMRWGAVIDSFRLRLVATVANRIQSGARVRAPLTELENEVMTVVWASAPVSVEAVHQAVSQKRRLKESTARTLLRRLEQKGYLHHDAQGRAYVYSAAEPARSLAGRAVRQIIDRLCQGSVEELVSGMVDARVLSKGELDRLAEFVRKKRE